MRVTDGQGNNRNFLASDANYQFVRDMQKKNLIVPIVGDFAGPKALRAILCLERRRIHSIAARDVECLLPECGHPSHHFIEHVCSIWARQRKLS